MISLRMGKYAMRAGLTPHPFVEFRSNVQEPDRWLIEYAGGHPTASGQVMTERTAVQVSAAYCCVDLISNSVATSPLCIYQKNKDKTRREATEHPIYDLLHNLPNPEMTSFTFRKTLMGHLLLWGNFYAEIEFDGSGTPVGLWPLAPDRTFPKRARGVGGAPNGPLVYISRSSSGPEVVLQPWQILHVMGYSYDGLRGLSPVALHRETLGLSTAATDYGARFFGNDARPGGVLEYPGKLKKEAAQRLKESWDEAHRGGTQGWRTAVLEEGIKFNATQMPNEDAQFLQTRIFQISEVSRMYHVPLHKLAELSHATFSNIEAQEIEYVKGAVMPWAEGFEHELERKLLRPDERAAGYYCEFNLDAHMRGDVKSRFEAYDIAWKDGWLNADEIAQRENWDPLPNGQGQTYFVPVTQQPLARALTAPPTGVLGAPGTPNAGTAPKSGAGGQGTGVQQPPPLPAGTPHGSWIKLHEGGGDWVKWKVASLRELSDAYAANFALVLNRLQRKETAALSRATTNKEKFISEHGSYVNDAVEPLFSAMRQSCVALVPAGYGVSEDFEKEYRAGFVHRYLEGLRLGMSTDPAFEAERAIAAFSGIELKEEENEL